MIIRRLRLCIFALVLPPAQALAAEQPQAPAADAARPPTADNRQLARKKANEGRELYLAGRWRDAYERFFEAEQLHHAQTLVLYLARCQHRLGKLVEARALYRQILAEPLAKDAPQQYVEAQRDAERELAQVQAELLKEEADARPAKRPAAGPAASPEPQVATPKRARGSLLPAGLTLGLGGASLAVGTVTGILSLQKTSDLRSKCPNYRCGPSYRDDVDRAALLGDISTATFIVGTAAATTGAALLIVRASGGAAPATTGSAARAAPSVRWSAGVGLGRLDVRAEF